MKKLLLVATIALSAFTFGACKKGGGGEDKAKFAALCAEADKQIKEGAASDDETFRMQMGNVMKACSMGCDAKDDASCGILDKFYEKTCGVSVSVCDSLCESATSPSLKKYACDHGTKK